MSEKFISQPTQETQEFFNDKSQSVPTSKWFDSLYPKAGPISKDIESTSKEGIKNLISSTDKHGDALAASVHFPHYKFDDAAQRSDRPNIWRSPDVKPVNAVMKAGKAATSAVDNLPKLSIHS